MRNRFVFGRWFSSSGKRRALPLLPPLLLLLLTLALVSWAGAGGSSLAGPGAVALSPSPAASPGEGQGREARGGGPTAHPAHPDGAGCHWMVASADAHSHSHPSGPGASAAPPPEWEILGHYTEACNCEVGCPCIYKSAPSHGDCNATLAFSITKGHFGPVDLSGLNAVVVGEVAKGTFVTYYVDDRATTPQREALTGIFRGIFGILSKNDLGVKVVPIRTDAWSQDSERQIRGVTIPDLLLLEVEKITGLDGQGPTRVNNPVHFINELLVAKSKIYRFRDHGKSWEITGRSGFHAEFFFSSLYFK